jgi:hypothetical protein
LESITIKFSENEIHEQCELFNFLGGNRADYVLNDITEWLRSVTKYGTFCGKPVSNEIQEFCQELRTRIGESAQERKVDL